MVIWPPHFPTSGAQLVARQEVSWLLMQAVFTPVCNQACLTPSLPYLATAAPGGYAEYPKPQSGWRHAAGSSVHKCHESCKPDKPVFRPCVALTSWPARQCPRLLNISCEQSSHTVCKQACLTPSLPYLAPTPPSPPPPCVATQCRSCSPNPSQTSLAG